MCRLTEGILKQFGFTKAEHHQMLCHDWLSSRHVTIGTRAGKVLLLEDAELKQTIDVSSLIESSDISATNGTYTLFYKARLLFTSSVPLVLRRLSNYRIHIEQGCGRNENRIIPYPSRQTGNMFINYIQRRLGMFIWEWKSHCAPSTNLKRGR